MCAHCLAIVHKSSPVANKGGNEGDNSGGSSRGKIHVVTYACFQLFSKASVLNDCSIRDYCGSICIYSLKY